MTGRFRVGLMLGCWLLLIIGVPSGDATIGGWWRARNTPTTSSLFPSGPSTATHTLTGTVYHIDMMWSGGAGPGTVTFSIFDPQDGAIVRQGVLPAAEDVSSMAVVDCPWPGATGALFIVPLYSLISPGVLEVGPGAPRGGGMARESFCNDPNVPDNGNPALNDPLYFKAFSDFEGDLTVIPVIEEYDLVLHIRGLDHG